MLHHSNLIEQEYSEIALLDAQATMDCEYKKEK